MILYDLEQIVSRLRSQCEGHISLEVIKVYYAHLSIVSIPTSTIEIEP